MTTGPACTIDPPALQVHRPGASLAHGERRSRQEAQEAVNEAGELRSACFGGHIGQSSFGRGPLFLSENDVMRVWFLRVFVICGFLCFFENVSCFEERV